MFPSTGQNLKFYSTTNAVQELRSVRSVFIHHELQDTTGSAFHPVVDLADTHTNDNYQADTMMAMDSEELFMSYQRELFKEFYKEVINWNQVSWLVKTHPTICRETDENGWLPLEFAITKNAPLAVIKLLVNSWNENGDHHRRYWITPLHLACSFDAPSEVIYYLADEFPDGVNEKDKDDRTALHYVMRANRELDLMRCVAEQWPADESLDFYSEDDDNERALRRLEENDPTLEVISIKKEHLSLREVNAIASNSTLNRVDLECGAVESLLWTEETQDALINALKTNTSIKAIGITMWQHQDLSAIIEVVKHSQGLEHLIIDCKKQSSDDSAQIVAFAEALRKVVSLRSLTLKQWYIYPDRGGAALAHILDLPMKRLILSDCDISKEAADLFVEASKNREHSFTNVDLFSWTGFPKIWPLEPWKISLGIELRKLTWRNCFQEEKVTFLDGVLRQKGMPEKRLLFAVERGSRYDYDNKWKQATPEEKLLLAVDWANQYDNESEFSDAPNMLFSLFRESPLSIMQAMADDRAQQGKKKRQKL
jgi:hypothetical protein